MKFLDDFLTLSKRERHGLIWLLCILGGVITIKTILANRELPPLDFSGQEAKVEAFFAQHYEVADSPRTHEDFGEQLAAEPVAYFPFDPNTITLEQWVQLGLSQKQAEVVVNYRNAGGRFHNADDLDKLYCLSAESSKALKPWVKIEEFQDDDEKARPSPSPVVEVRRMIELNSADTAALKSLSGVGSFYARKIVELRDRLGGFHSYDQLMDIWKMDEAKVKSIADQSLIDPSAISKISLNKATAEELQGHPYISWKVANSIVKIREQHGEYERVEDIQKSALIDAPLYERLRPYLSCDD